MKLFRRPTVFLVLAALAATLLTACMTSGPQKALNSLAEALGKNDASAFMAGLDIKSYAANEVKNMTRSHSALNSLNSLGKALGLDNMEGLLANMLDAENELRSKIQRGVSTGELVALCTRSEKPDCPWVPQSLKAAEIRELGETAAIAKITTPARMTSWLALQKKGETWLVVGQAPLEETARGYAEARAGQPAAGQPAASAPEQKEEKKPEPQARPRQEKDGEKLI